MLKLEIVIALKIFEYVNTCLINKQISRYIRKNKLKFHSLLNGQILYYFVILYKLKSNWNDFKKYFDMINENLFPELI